MARGKRHSTAVQNSVLKTDRQEGLKKLQRAITPEDVVVFSHLNPERHKYVPMFARQFEAFAEHARMEGARVVHLPYRDENFDDILYRVPDYPQGGYGFYSGGVIEESFYKGLEEAALKKGIVLINTSEDNAKAMLFENYYSVIEDLTAKSIIIKSHADVAKAESLEFPLFVKGRIKSNKEKGWDACVVNNSDELMELAEAMFEHGEDASTRPNNFSELGVPQIIAREILPLKKLPQERYHADFPISREYRVYMYGNNVIDMGYYWADEDQFGSLTLPDHDQIISICKEATGRLNLPLSCVDVGQLEDGTWKIIELGDPQHTGVANMPKGLFVRKLCAHLSCR